MGSLPPQASLPLLRGAITVGKGEGRSLFGVLEECDRAHASIIVANFKTFIF
ncbi:MAG: hypothetical protein ACYT04_43370 [Nostoc sp.]